ncbi:MAG: hypothetical protein J0I20_23970 [Chloroflexi bacterium]|nr:hypothetical protein [Chloroflexota bacterium]OJW03396.1 MAG: hypothetical protein BGO39_10325 [Chloroflexi bacterium 54-19]
MAFNYSEVGAYINLQLKELESLLNETRQAIETLQHTRNLLEQHQYTILRLAQVEAQMKSLDNRMVEIAENQRLLDPKLQNRSLETGALPGRITFAQARKAGFSQKLLRPKNEAGNTFLKPDNTPTGTQHVISQLEQLQLSNLYMAQENLYRQLEKELKSLESQLALTGFKETPLRS